MDVLERLYRKLAEAAERERPGDPRPSFTIAEVYQQLVPYRAVRGDLGLVELAHYEHALLRLLAGERGYASVDLPAVNEELQRELVATNPILGVYRDYAAVEVTVNLPRGAVTASPAPLPPLPPLPEPRSRPAASEPVSLPAEAPPQTRPCSTCEVPLPAEQDVRFCPLCGADQPPSPCQKCGTPLSAEWNFCIRCGNKR